MIDNTLLILSLITFIIGHIIAKELIQEYVEVLIRNDKLKRIFRILSEFPIINIILYVVVTILVFFQTIREFILNYGKPKLNIQVSDIYETVQRLQWKYDKLLIKHDLLWMPSYFGDDITKLTTKQLDEGFIVILGAGQDYMNWEVDYEHDSGSYENNSGILEYCWMDGTVKDEDKELRKLFIKEIENLIHDKQIEYHKSKTIVPLYEQELDKLKNVLKEI